MASFKGNTQFATLLLGLLLHPAVEYGMPAAACTAPISVLDEVDVRSDTVSLADLLPPNVSSGLREAAATIALGRAPQVRQTRTIGREELQNDVQGVPQLSECLDLPEQILVNRSNRELTRLELERAIAVALEKEGASDPELAGMKTLLLAAPVYVTQDDPGLQVLRVEFDALRRETRFCLWTSREPEILPFYVSVRGAISHSLKSPETLAAHSTRGPGVAGARKGGPPQRPVSLVREGRRAMLVVDEGAVHISASVIPLGSGAMGDAVRVRNLDSQRIIVASVVGKDRLIATSQD